MEENKKRPGCVLGPGGAAEKSTSPAAGQASSGCAARRVMAGRGAAAPKGQGQSTSGDEGAAAPRTPQAAPARSRNAARQQKRTAGREQLALLSVCYLAQLLIGASQPFGLPAGQLLAVLAAGTLVQLAVYRLLAQRRLPASPVWGWALALLLCLNAGYDIVRADRFYRAVTAQELSFWWLTASMLLIGWYAARCGRPTVLRTALPVLAALGASLLALALTGSLRLENLQPLQWHKANGGRMALVFLEYTFSAEPLLWLFWRAHPLQAAEAAAGGQARAGQGAAALRWASASVFAVLGELTLGSRFAGTPQVFGVLSLVSAGADANHGGALYHGVWLMALAVRVCAVCCTLREVCAGLLPKTPQLRRVLAEGAALLAAAALWGLLWQRDCLTLLAAGALLLTGGALLTGKGKPNAQK